MFEILSRRSWVWLQPVVASLWFLPASLATDMHFKWTGDSKLSPSVRGQLCLWMIWEQRRTRGDGKYMDVAGFDHGNITWLRSLMFFHFLRKYFFFVLFFYLGLCVKRLHYISCVKYIVSSLLKKEMNKLPKTLCRNQLLFQMSWFCF